MYLNTWANLVPLHTAQRILQYSTISRKPEENGQCSEEYWPASICPPRVTSIFYKAVVQAILLYSSETWVLTKHTLTMLETFHHRVARQITGRHAYQQPDGSWYTPSPQPVLEAAGLFSMTEYIRQRRQYIRDYLLDHPVTALGQAQQRDGNHSNQKFIWDNPTDPLIKEEVGDPTLLEDKT